MTDQNCSCTPNPCPCPDEKPAAKKRGLRDIFKTFASCGCSGAGAFVAGHAGCIITPIVIAAAGATTAAAGLSALALAFGAAATAGGLYAWHKIRGKKAGGLEKAFVIASAGIGLLISTSMHLRHHHEGYPRGVQHGAVMCGAPVKP